MTPGYPLKFGKYLLLERINVGGMAEVFKAKAFGVAGFQRILAIKRILPSLAEDEEFVRMFIDEARIAVHLQHASIIKIDELGQYGSHYYIAMDYLPSRDLRAILDRMRSTGQLMPIAQAAYIVSRVCEGLDYAHRKKDHAGNAMNIIHRDISPQNVLIGFDGEVKVIDFGIAKAANRASKTQAGVLKGKFAYMSPEQVRGLPTDRRADVFSVGVLLYELLTGERLFIGESDLSTLERVRNAVVQTPSDFNKKISPELEQIVLKALARDVEDRYQWASELSEDLGRFQLDGHTLFGTKQLSKWMKKVYAQEIQQEQQSMVQFLEAGNDENMAEVPALTSQPSAAPVNDGFGFDADDDYSNLDEAAVPDYAPEETGEVVTREVEQLRQEEESEDKTFIIEAADNSGIMAAIKRERAQAAIREETNDHASNDASLYSGEEDSEEDDGKTEVSFVNPFLNDSDTNVSSPEQGGAKPGLGRPGVSPAVGHKIIDSEEDEPLDSDEDPTMIRHEGLNYSFESDVPPPPGDSGMTPPPPLPGMSAEALNQTIESEILPLPPVVSETATATVPQKPPQPAAAPAPAQAAPAAPPPASRVQPPGDDGPTEYMKSERQLNAPGQSSKISKEIYFLAGGIGVALMGLLVAIFVLVSKMDGSGQALEEPAIAIRLVDDLTVQGIEIKIDGQVMATGIPSELTVSASEPHQLEILSKDGEVWKNGLPPLESGESITVEVPNIFGAVPKEPAEDTKDNPEEKKADSSEQMAKAKETKSSGAEKSDEKPKDKADSKPESKDGEDKAKTVAQKDTAGQKDGAAKEQPSAADKDGDSQKTNPKEPDYWRVSLTAVSNLDRRLIKEGEVLRQGTPIGRIPFEMEFEPNLKKVRLVIRAEGYAQKEIELTQNGQSQTGPATVRLLSLAEMKKADSESSDKKTGADGEKENSDKASSESGSKAATKEKQGQDEPTAKAAAKEPPGKAKEPQAEASSTSAEASSEKKTQPTKGSSKSATAEKTQPTKATPKKSGGARTAKKSSPPKSKTKSGKGNQSAKGKMSVLKIGAQPQAKIWIDKKSYGTTPLMHKKAPKLSIGSHFMMVQDVVSGKRYKYRFEITKDNPKNTLIVYPEGNKIRTKGNVKARKLD